MPRRNRAPLNGESDDEEARTVEIRFGPPTRPRASTGVIETVAAATGSEPEELEPLHDTVEPDALDALCASGPVGADASPVTVSFSYEGCDVTVRSDGRIAVTPPPTD